MKKLLLIACALFAISCAKSDGANGDGINKNKNFITIDGPNSKTAIFSRRISVLLA